MRRHVLNVCLRLVARPALRLAGSPERQARAFDLFGPRLCPGPPLICHLKERIEGLRLHWVSVGQPDARRIILYLHGGAFIVGSGKAYRGFLGHISDVTGYRVCAPDYRLLQQAPFPAAFEDALKAWDALLQKGHRPSDIILGGDSAGGGLMLSLLAELCTRGTSPAACFAMSPWTDMTLSGDSLQSTAEVLLPVERMPEVVARFLHGARADDPRASPLFARFDAPPPVLIQVGSGEALFDDASRMAEALGDAATLRVWPDVPHVWPFFHGYMPEARAALKEIAAFLQTSLDNANR